MKDKKEKYIKQMLLDSWTKIKFRILFILMNGVKIKSGGLGVAEHFPELAERIFKTIVLKGKSKSLYVCVIHGRELILT